MRRLWISGLLLASFAGCAGEVSGTEEQEIERSLADEEAPIDANAQALAGSTVPPLVVLGDQTIDGIDNRAYTRHGFVFRSALRTTRANAIIENHANAAMTFRLVLTESCRQSNGSVTTQRAEVTATVQPGSEHFQEVRCSSGTPITTIATWDRIDTRATDIGYSENFNAHMSIGIGSSASQPNVEAYGRRFLRGVNKHRSTWGAIEVTNFGSSPQVINFLVQRTTCSRSGMLEKFVSNVTVQPGAVVTSTKGCPSGETVVSSFGIFGQSLP
jgi:hypothetical protein